MPKVTRTLWQLWENAVAEKPWRTLGIACFSVSFLWGWYTLQKHWSFHSSSFDLGIFTNTLWNFTFQGQYLSSVKGGINLFADHQSPIFILLSPFFYFFPHAETLLIIQAIALSSGGVFVYLLGRQQQCSAWVLATLPLLYWAYLPIRAANAFDFHPEVLMLPLFLAALCVFGSARGKTTWGFICGVSLLILALGAKESAGYVAAGLGLSFILECLTKTRVLAGFSLFLIGCAVFYFDTQKVPALFGADYAYGTLYASVGTSFHEILTAPFLKPHLLIEKMNYDRYQFLLWTLAPLAFLPLFSWRRAIAALPAFAALFLLDGNHRLSHIYHYGIEPAVGLFWALPAGFEKANSFFKTQRSQKLFKFWVFFCLILAIGTKNEIIRIFRTPINPHHQWLSQTFLPTLSPIRSFAATDSLVPHIANRAWVGRLPHLQIPDTLLVKSASNGTDSSNGWVDCVLIDTDLNGWPLSQQEIDQLIQSLPAKGYREVYQHEHLRLFARETLPEGGCFRAGAAAL